MYSEEINVMISNKEFLTLEEYRLASDVHKNPQIDHIKYDPFEDSYHIWTNDGWHWSFRLKGYVC